MFVGKPGANYTDEFFFSFRVNDNHDSTIDRSDGGESVFGLKMLSVEDLQIVVVGLEELLRLSERHTMLILIASILCIVLFEFHRLDCRPMTQ